MNLHEEISFAISKSQYTVHAFAQQLNIKLKTLLSYMDGTVIPEKKIITKMNKFLNTKISYPQN
tara:strand:+ start:286 stop:477 length:192 start_codon:yes stop_codon:yes gene_type:complete